MADSRAEALRRELERRLKAMQKPRDARWPHWQAIGELVQPRTGRFNEDVARLDREGDMNQAIINSIGTLAHRIMKSGMHTGLTSHTSPWFARRFRNEALNDWGPAKEWLEGNVRRCYDAFDRSTFYRLAPDYYGDAGLFGIASMHIDAHPSGGIVCSRHPIGTYSIANGNDGLPDSIYIEYTQTVRKLVDQYGTTGVSERVQRMYDNHDTEAVIKCVQAIEPNDDRVPAFRDYRGMPWRSVKWELNSEIDELLDLSGYHEFPVLITVWSKDQDDLWGGGPAFEALPDLRMAQKLESLELEQLDKVADPAVNAPASMRQDGVSTNPGEHNWVSEQGSPGVVPVLNFTPAIDPIEAKVLKTEARVMQHFFANLFEAINQSATPGNRRDRTAREVEELHREKLIQLIPALESFFRSFLAPAVDRCWNILSRQDLLEPPPPGLEEEELKTEFTSTLALAQRAVENNAINDGMAFVGSLFEMDQTVVDRVNFDGATSRYFDNIGMPAEAVNSDDEVERIKEQRAQQQAEDRSLQQAEQGGKAAKDLAAAEISETNALGQVFGGFGAPVQ